jgi:hypothetical protein
VKRFSVVFLVLLGAYLSGYAFIRMTGIERWEHDGHDYVILPASSALYYFYRPLMYLDAETTGMRFHIGPHRNESIRE